jgi:hypothetical protein
MSGDIINRLMKRKNISKSEAVKEAQQQGYYDNPTERSQRTANAQASAEADYQERNKAPPTFWEQVGSTLEDVAPTVAELALHAIEGGSKEKEEMRGAGWYDDIKEWVNRQGYNLLRKYHPAFAWMPEAEGSGMPVIKFRDEMTPEELYADYKMRGRGSYLRPDRES